MRIFIIIFLLFLIFWGAGRAQGNDLRQEIYSNITGGCEGRPLSEERCYKAQMTKAYVDVLISKGLTAEEIYMKLVERYSSTVILNKDIREETRLRVAADVKTPKPRMALETFNLHFGAVSQFSERIAGKVKVFNKGKAPLYIYRLKTSCGCIDLSLQEGFSMTERGAMLGPQQEGAIGIVLDLQHKKVKVGDLNEFFIVFSDDPHYPQARITIDADVNEEPVKGQEGEDPNRPKYKPKPFRASDSLPRSRSRL